ncbi:hypothetical protein M758_4G203300 [Ceratodon purpureus]|nr:hypothetical protein M758_4G203300 [Ceratodon purpureus]
MVAMLVAAGISAGRSTVASCLLRRHLLHAVGVSVAARERFSTTVTQDGSLSYLRNPTNGAQVYLVGTAHVSAKSAEQVREVINQVRPDKVAVELCEERAKNLLKDNHVRKGKTPFQQMQDLFNLPGGLGQKLIGFWLKSMYELIRNTGVEPGKEFRVAMEEAERLGAEILYIDRNVHATIKRLRDVITVWDVLRMLKNPNPHLDSYPSFMREMEHHDFETAVERLKTRETVREMMHWMEQSFPAVVKAMVHERDEIMVKRLLECEGTVVGVVGMAHMDGIERLWKEYTQ